MKMSYFTISIWLLAGSGYCQERFGTPPDYQHLTDELLSFQDEDVNYEDLYENLAQILSSPFDLNTVSAAELKQLHILTDSQIENFISYRDAQVRFFDVYELQVIPGFDAGVISRLLPFVKVVDPATQITKSLLRRMFSTGHSYFIARYERTVETWKGFKASSVTPSAFAGSPDKIYFRFRSAVSGDFSFGVTGEKDAGERLRFSPGSHPWGFDFTSWHFQLKNKGKLKNLVVGDFQSQFGQGLMFGGAFGLGKGGESISTTRKSSIGFQPYTSIHESAYHRGLAITYYPLKQIGISAYYSGARRDASAENESDSLGTSFQTTGYHRSESELMKRKKIFEQNAGIVIHLEKGRVDAGLLINSLNFSVPIRKTPTLYNQFAFSGSTHFNAGIFLNYRVANVSFFSEVARSMPEGGYGMVAGLLLSPHINLDVAILFRNYARDFYTFYSNAFSENSQPQNERGVYWGWKYRWDRRYSFNGYADLFSFPWLGFRRYAPSTGYEVLIRCNYQPSRNVSVFTQYREESRQWNVPGRTTLYETSGRIRRNLTGHCDYGVREKIRLRTRIQYSVQDFDGRTTEGWAVMQDVSFSVGRFQLTGRHGLFDTDHYDNRQYVYESDAFSSYSLPAYSGEGVRNYALIEYKLNKQLTIWLRYARTSMVNGGEITNGPNAIEGNTRNDVKFQARFTF